ncbi:MAG TPA: MarR family transcriptional regulator [Armatimonadota bacterium]|jgi:DNA-binding MarR family transcriptional regulator
MTKQDYEALAGFRRAIRRFLTFSEAAARDAGLTPQQHQLLLALRGYPHRDWATITELSERLDARQPAVTNIVRRMEVGGLVERRADQKDGRSVSVHATERGEEVLNRLSRQHLIELKRLKQEFPRIEHLGRAVGAGDLDEGERDPESTAQ